MREPEGLQEDDRQNHHHFHHARQSLGNADPIFISHTVARDKIVFTMIETAGTIWMATLEHRSRLNSQSAISR